MQNERDSPVNEVDVTLAVILAVCVTISVPLNLIAFGYFRNKREQRKNGLFFNRLYMIASATDALICVMQLPTIDSLFNRRNSRTWTFDNDYFCKFWAAVKEVSVVLSIFLVAILSISRLHLLKQPNRQLPPSLPCILPLGFVLFFCAIIPSLYSINYLNARPSESGSFMCYLCGYFQTKNGTGGVSFIAQADLEKYMVVQCVRTFFAGLPFFPILLSFSISMVLLKRSRSRVSTTASIRRQERASSTIVLFTSLYVVCNVPLTIYMIYLTSLVADVLYKTRSSVTRTLNYSEYEATFSGSYFERHYVWIIGVNLSIVLNSSLNPILYIWRMKHFREFIMNMGKYNQKNHSTSLDSPPLVIRNESKL